MSASSEFSTQAASETLKLTRPTEGLVAWAPVFLVIPRVAACLKPLQQLYINNRSLRLDKERMKQTGKCQLAVQWKEKSEWKVTLGCISALGGAFKTA
jgi:hypothetical protein